MSKIGKSINPWGISTNIVPRDLVGFGLLGWWTNHDEASWVMHGKDLQLIFCAICATSLKYLKHFVVTLGHHLKGN